MSSENSLEIKITQLVHHAIGSLYKNINQLDTNAMYIEKDKRSNPYIELAFKHCLDLMKPTKQASQTPAVSVNRFIRLPGIGDEEI